MTLEDIEAQVRKSHLTIFGALHTRPEDKLGDGTLLLLGPHEPGFWPYVSAEPEFNDKAPDPMDRWSDRVIRALAASLGGTALFPFGQPPQPFISWALRSGSTFVSPVSLLVHAKAGLFVSFRGAILVPRNLEIPPPSANPCDTCQDKHCLAACPSGALTEMGYNLDQCHDFLDTAEGTACMSQGCAVRRACPFSAKYPRLHAQSAFHMKAFHK